ncbi:MAG: hypothetical protein AB1695_14530 [Stygiobacter sp.]
MGYSKEILNLFDTFLGKFKFFRQFIKILLKMEEEINSISKEINTINENLKKLNSLVLDLESEIKELSEHVNSLTSLNRELNSKNPRDIMTEIYNKYNNDIN